jgi:hypothetical protein
VRRRREQRVDQHADDGAEEGVDDPYAAVAGAEGEHQHRGDRDLVDLPAEPEQVPDDQGGQDQQRHRPQVHAEDADQHQRAADADGHADHPAGRRRSPSA